jgi:hypothetical protein
MPKSTKKAASRKRTSVKQLPKAKQQLTGKSMKKVKGGLITVRKAGEKPVEY